MIWAQYRAVVLPIWTQRRTGTAVRPPRPPGSGTRIGTPGASRGDLGRVGGTSGFMTFVIGTGATTSLPEGPGRPETRAMTTENVITCRGLRFAYGSTEVIRGIDLTVGRGDLFALLGTNGAGKTTALELLLGERPAGGGTVRILGRDPWLARRAVATRVGVVPQDGGCAPDLTVRETLRLWLRLRGCPAAAVRATELLDEVRLAPQAARRVRQLSGGERRRLDLAVALCGDPALLMLDEPTSGLDPESRRHTWQLLRDRSQRGTTILFTTHYLEEADALADRVAIMDAGHVALCAPTAQLRRSGSLAETFHRIAGAEVSA
jgi:ABC-2 type transport system ATP-binding protein